jgi:hypothetical protein
MFQFSMTPDSKPAPLYEDACISVTGGSIAVTEKGRIGSSYVLVYSN